MQISASNRASHLASPQREASDLRDETEQTMALLLVLSSTLRKYRQLGPVLGVLSWPSSELCGFFSGSAGRWEILSTASIHGADVLQIETSRTNCQWEIWYF